MWGEARQRSAARAEGVRKKKKTRKRPFDSILKSFLSLKVTNQGSYFLLFFFFVFFQVSNVRKRENRSDEALQAKKKKEKKKKKVKESNVRKFSVLCRTRVSGGVQSIVNKDI